jgi:hypothetical protein
VFGVARDALLASDKEVVLLACRVLVKVLAKLPKLHLQQAAWEWFSLSADEGGGGAEAVLASYRRHSSAVVGPLFVVIESFSKPDHWLECLLDVLQAAAEGPAEYMSLLHDLLGLGKKYVLIFFHMSNILFSFLIITYPCFR